MLELRELSRSFGETHAVRDVSLSIPRGQMVGVIGRSGAGKSTLLRLINRLVEPSAGGIHFDGIDVSGLRGSALLGWRRRSAMIFQQFNLVGRLDVLTNVLIGRVGHVPTWRSLARLWPERDRLLALSLLERVDIGEFAAQRADTLSGGQQQRVAICRALAQEPELVLADEPIASLDPRNTKIVMDALAAMNRELGMTVLCNLHSLDLARSYCGRLIGMAQGRVVFDGSPAELTDAVAQELYGLEAGDVVDAASCGRQPRDLEIRPALAAA
jgi:phosphonate transport system ATP-binding protein